MQEGRYRAVWIRFVRIGALLLVAACGRVDFDEVEGSDSGLDAGGDSAADAGGDSAADSGIEACPVSPDGDTLAFYDMEDLSGGVLRDATGAHPGSFTGVPRVTEGPSGCGNGVLFRDGAWGQIPDAPAWDLATGSIDFWVRLPPPPPAADYVVSMLSRDADETALPGHISIFQASDGRIALRLQTPGSFVRCTEAPVPSGTWVHVGVNLGPPDLELYVNGLLAGSTGTFPITEGIVYDCGAPTQDGIAGNDNPWVIGASSGASVEGGAEPVNAFFEDGAMDQLRVSRVRRRFAE